MTRVGLRIDVDTLRGTRDGVPRLLEILARHGVKASFFFCVGPDNMGRHLWRLVNPRFAWKMLRSGAASLYGWEILLAGTLWPGRNIARRCAAQIRATEAAGHEVGLHGWDHHRWQARAEDMSAAELRAEIARGVDTLTEILGHAPSCSAAPGWICNERILAAKESFAFAYNSDCRGRSPFVPWLDGQEATVQIPTTLPTYDEAVGREGLKAADYNDWLLEQIGAEAFNVLTIHAEVEGLACAEMFDSFLSAADRRGIELVPLGRLLDDETAPVRSRIVSAPVAGRAGTVGWQEPVPVSAH